MILEREKLEREKAEFAARKKEQDVAAVIAATTAGGPIPAAPEGTEIKVQNTQQIQNVTNITYVVNAPAGQQPMMAPDVT